MSSRIQCQALTLKGIQCKRKADINCKFCKQHSVRCCVESQQYKHVPETIQLVKNIHHGPRAFIFKHKPLIHDFPENQCCLKNTLGEFICKHEKCSNSNFCSGHTVIFDEETQKLKEVEKKYIEQTKTRNFINELNAFLEYSREIIKFKKYFLIFSQNKIAENFIEEFYFNCELSFKYSYNFSVCFINDQLSEIRNDVENLCVFKQIEMSKQKIKINEIKLNMLNEIYIKEQGSKFIQPVFTNLINEKIFSMLF